MVTSRFGRWLSVVRAQRPALLLSYPLLFFPTLPLLLLSLLASALWLGLAIAGLAITARVLVAIAALSASRRRVALRDLAFAPLADVVLLVAWLRALASRRVEWRGQQLRLSRRGELQRIAA